GGANANERPRCHVDLGCAPGPRPFVARPSFVREPEGNGVAERFIRTLKENLPWVRHFATVTELVEALREFRRRYNEQWLIGRKATERPRGSAAVTRDLRRRSHDGSRRFTTMSSRQQNADPQLATGPPVSPQTEDYRPTGATASSLITRPPFSASLRFDEETRVLLRQRLLQIWIVFGLCLLALIMYSLAGVGEAMAYGADPKLGA